MLPWVLTLGDCPLFAGHDSGTIFGPHWVRAKILTLALAPGGTPGGTGRMPVLPNSRPPPSETPVPVPVKVIHTAAPLEPTSGVFSSVREMTQAMERHGLTNHVLMPAGVAARPHLDSWLPVRAECHGKVIIPLLLWSPDFAREVLASDAEVLHTHSFWQHPSLVALAWKAKTGRPHVASVHGSLQPWAWRSKAWKKWPVWWMAERRNLQSASLLHASSEEEAAALRARGLRVPIAVISHGVTFPIDQIAPPPKAIPRTALILGRLNPKKGIPLLLEAWARIRPKQWVLHIAGPDQEGHLKQLKRQVQRLGLGGLVRFSGPLMDEAREQAFRECELLILPTYSENFGMVVAEALARRIPVITTHGAPWQDLEKEACGWWVPVSVPALAAALDAAAACSPESLAAMGVRGRAYVASRCDPDLIARQFIDCYQWVLGKGPKPECVVV